MLPQNPVNVIPPDDCIQLIETELLPGVLNLLGSYYKTLAHLHGQPAGAAEYVTDDFIPAFGDTLLKLARGTAAAFDDLNRHGDDTAAALALGDLWLGLSEPRRRDVTEFTRQLLPTSDIWPAFDDLNQHGDFTGAALALGDIWLVLPAAARAKVASTVKGASNGR